MYAEQPKEYQERQEKEEPRNVTRGRAQCTFEAPCSRREDTGLYAEPTFPSLHLEPSTQSKRRRGGAL